MHHHASAVLALVGVASAMNHQVMVGASGMLQFSPSTITAAKGDTVEFMWQGEKHSVTEGDSSNACHPMSGSPFNSGAISSGNWMITINSTDPIYYYCGVFSHCQEGMVGGINVPSSDFSMYKSAAASEQNNVLPAAVQGGSFGSASATGASSGMMSGSATSAMMSSSSASAMMSGSSASAMMSSSSASAMMSSSSVSGMMASSSSASSSSMASSASAQSTSSGNGAVATRVAGLIAGLPVALAAFL